MTQGLAFSVFQVQLCIWKRRHVSFTQKHRASTTVQVFYLLIQAIFIAPLQINYYSEALPAQHGYCVGVSHRSATGNCEWRTCLRSLRGDKTFQTKGIESTKPHQCMKTRNVTSELHHLGLASASLNLLQPHVDHAPHLLNEHLKGV